jgi:hypothetical protein
MIGDEVPPSSRRNWDEVQPGSELGWPGLKKNYRFFLSELRRAAARGAPMEVGLGPVARRPSDACGRQRPCGAAKAASLI